MSQNKHFGKVLDNYITEKGIVKAWLARKLKIKPQALQSLFKARNPLQETVDRVLSILKITEEELYAFNGSTEVQEPKALYKTKDEIDFEKAKREWEIKENEYLRQINELQQARIKELEEQSRA